MAFNNPTESLTSVGISSVSKANRLFGEDKSLLLARPTRRKASFWFTVPEGFYALVTRHGALEYYKDSNGEKTCVWPSGLHLGPPWLRVSQLVTKQSIVFNTPIRGCRTKDNVTVNIDVAIILRVMGEEDPENVFKFVHMVTARGLQQQLVDAQAEAVRTLARSMTHTEVFGIRSVSEAELTGVQRNFLGGRAPVVAPLVIGKSDDLDIVDEEKEEEKASESDRASDIDIIGEHDDLDPLEAGFNTETGASVTLAMKDRLNRQFVPQGVEILDVIIQQITVPSFIQEQMANKTYVISQNAEQRMQQKLDLLSLRQQQNLKSLSQKHTDLKEELIIEGKLEAHRKSLLLQQEKALGAAALLNIETRKAIHTRTITAESNREVRQVRDNTNLQATELRVKSKAEAAERCAIANAKVEQLKAKADLECAKMSAQGDKALFQAEGVTAPLIRTLNEHKTALKKYEAQEELASNKKLILTGTSGGEAANRLILIEATLNDAATNRTSASAAETSAVLSQIAVASGKAEVRLNMWGATNTVRTSGTENPVNNEVWSDFQYR